MKEYSSFEDFRANENGTTSLTIGVFDGLHRGHKALICKAVEGASEGHDSLVITFNQHPLSMLAPPYAPRRLIYSDRKRDMIQAMGIDFLLSIDFTQEFSQLPPEEFIREFLVNCCRAKIVACGYDFRFGRKGTGSIGLMRQMGESLGFRVQVLDPISRHDVFVKSSAVRDVLFAGEVEKAADLLTRAYELRGRVVTGFARGREIGFPTANIDVSMEHVIPARGVYLCSVRLPDSAAIHYAMLNIGYNPTFGLERLSIEAHIFHFSGDLVGREIGIFFLRRLRDERKFESVDALIEQLESDKAHCKKLIAQPEIKALAEQA